MQNNYRYSAFFASLMALFMFGLVCVHRIGFETPFLDLTKALALFYFIVFAPIIFPKNLQNQEVWWQKPILWSVFLFLFFALLGFLTRFLPFLQVFSWVFGIVGFGLWLRFMYLFFKDNTFKFLLSIFFLAFAWGTYLLSLVYAKFVYNPIFLESISFYPNPTEYILYDVTYHSDIAAMYQTYQMPTTGVDGLIWMHYNTATHWIFGHLALLLKLPVTQFYHWVYPFLVIPFFFYTFFSLITSLYTFFATQTGRKPSRNIFSFAFWIIFLVFLTPFPNNIYAYGLLGFHFAQVATYVMALAMLFAWIEVQLAYFAKPSNLFIFKWIFIPFTLFVVGFSHVAIAVVFVAVWGYLFLRLAYYKNIFDWLWILLLTAILFACYLLTAETNIFGQVKSYEGAVEWFFFFKQKEFNLLDFIVGLYLPLGLLTFLYVREERKSARNLFLSKKTMFLEILCIAALAGLAPNMVLALYGSTGMYFMSVQRFLAIACLLAYMPFVSIDGIASKNWFKYLRWTAYTAISVLIVLLIKIYGHTFGDAWRNNLNIRAIIQNVPLELKIDKFTDNIQKLSIQKTNIPLLFDKSVETNALKDPYYQFVRTIARLDSLPVLEKSKSLLYIPYYKMPLFRNFNDHFAGQQHPVLVSALSGIASIRGLPSPKLKDVGAYGYSYYDYSSREKTWKEGYTLPELKEIIQKKYPNKFEYLWIYEPEKKIFTKNIL